MKPERLLATPSRFPIYRDEAIPHPQTPTGKLETARNLQHYGVNYFSCLLSPMKLQFTAKDVTFFPEDQDYFESRLQALTPLIKKMDKAPDSVFLRVHIHKDHHHHKGLIFITKFQLEIAGAKDFYTEISAENIKKCADLGLDKLRQQLSSHKH